MYCHYCHPLNSNPDKQLVARLAESNCLLARNKSSQLKKCGAPLVHVYSLQFTVYSVYRCLQLAKFASAKHLNTCSRPGSMHPNGRPPGRTVDLLGGLRSGGMFFFLRQWLWPMADRKTKTWQDSWQTTAEKTAHVELSSWGFLSPLASF